VRPSTVQSLPEAACKGLSRGFSPHWGSINQLKGHGEDGINSKAASEHCEGGGSLAP